MFLAFGLLRVTLLVALLFFLNFSWTFTRFPHDVCAWRFFTFDITARKRSLWRLCFYTCVSVHRGHAWQGCVWQGACMVGSMRSRGRAMHGRRGMHGRGHTWPGGMHGRGCAWQGPCMPQQILWDTVNERVVRILLEWILVFIIFCASLVISVLLIHTNWLEN